MDETESVEDYLEYFLENLSRREAVDVFLVLLGERPACLVMDPDGEERETLKRFCRENGLYYRQVEGGESLLSSSGFFIAADQDRFDMIQGSEGRFYGLSDRDVGRFLGFPEDDIDFFAENVEDGPVEAETREVVEDLVSRGELDPGEGRFVELTTYVPEPSEENVKRAVETGKAYRNALLRFDEENSSEIGRRVLESFFGRVTER